MFSLINFLNGDLSVVPSTKVKIIKNQDCVAQLVKSSNDKESLLKLKNLKKQVNDPISNSMFSLVKFNNGDISVVPSTKVKIIKNQDCVVKWPGEASYHAQLVKSSNVKEKLLKLKKQVNDVGSQISSTSKEQENNDENDIKGSNSPNDTGNEHTNECVNLSEQQNDHQKRIQEVTQHHLD